MQSSSCSRRARPTPHHRLRSSSALGRSGLIANPERRSSSLYRYTPTPHPPTLLWFEYWGILGLGPCPRVEAQGPLGSVNSVIRVNQGPVLPTHKQPFYEVEVGALSSWWMQPTPRPLEDALMHNWIGQPCQGSPCPFSSLPPQVVPVAARLLLEMFSGELSWSADSIRLQISNPDLKDRMVEQFKELHHIWQSQQQLQPVAQAPPVAGLSAGQGPWPMHPVGMQ